MIYSILFWRKTLTTEVRLLLNHPIPHQCIVASVPMILDHLTLVGTDFNLQGFCHGHEMNNCIRLQCHECEVLFVIIINKCCIHCGRSKTGSAYIAVME